MKNTPARRSVISAIGAAGAAVVLGATTTRAQTPTASGRFQPTRHPEDAWLDAMPGKHRTVIDTFSVNGAGNALLFANNLFLSNAAGYRLTDSDVAVVITLRHQSVGFAFTDAIWAKYSAGLNEGLALIDPKTQQKPVVNLYNAQGHGTALPNSGQTIAALVTRGTHFAVCQMASSRVARQIAASMGATQEAIYKELMANLIPNAHMVASGVLAVTRAQEYGYTVLSAG
jgi:intracellular sulfur oxidation DsrE/DsrF family protein